MFELLLLLTAFCIFTLWFTNYRITKLTEIVNLEEKTRQEDLLALSMDFGNAKDHLLDLFFSANSHIKNLQTSTKDLSTQVQDLGKLFSSGLAEQLGLILDNEKQISDLSTLQSSLIEKKEEFQKYKVDLEDRMRRTQQKTSDLESEISSFLTGFFQVLNDGKADLNDFISKAYNSIEVDRKYLQKYLEDLKDALDRDLKAFDNRILDFEKNLASLKQPEVKGFISGTLQASPLCSKLETDIGFLAHEILRINNSIRELTEGLNQANSMIRSNAEQMDEKISSFGAQNLIADCISPLQEKLSAQEDSLIEKDFALNELREKFSALDNRLVSLISKIRSMI